MKSQNFGTQLLTITAVPLLIVASIFVSQYNAKEVKKTSRETLTLEELETVDRPIRKARSVSNKFVYMTERKARRDVEKADIADTADTKLPRK